MNIYSIIKEEIKSILKEFNSKSQYELLDFLQNNNLKNNDDFNFTNNGVLKIYVKNNNIDLLYDIIEKIEKFYGWFISGSIDENDFDSELITDDELIKRELKSKEKYDEYEPDEDIYTILIEPKYGNEFQPNKLPNKVYHITDEKYLDKIKKIGLIPKSKNKLTKHPDRIYLLLKKSTIDDLLDNPDFDLDNPVILTINIKDFKNKYKIYPDPNTENGAFTLNNIPPTLIEKIKIL